MPLDSEFTASSIVVHSPEVNAQEPWLGLLPYREEHREFFFGRDRELEDILGRIRDNSLTILYGQSGLGKSSLLAAGVMPRLREAGYAPRWARLSFEEGKRFQTLVQQTHVLISAAQGTLTAGDFEGEGPLQRLTFWERFHHRDAPTSPVPVLIFDQFEEIFTLGAQARFTDEVADWLEQMADLLQNRPPRHLAERFAQDSALAEQYHFDAAPVRIVFTLREDYLAQLERWKARLPLLMQNRMALTLLTGPQARQAVLGPAQHGDDSLVSREVAESIVRTVARVPRDTPLDQIKAVPPLLSLLCEQLNAARLSAGSAQITAESVRDQADDILQRFYVESFLSFPEEHRSRIRALLEDPPMITEAGYRNALVREDAEAQLTRAGVANAKAIFDTLIHRRLITSETRDEVQRLEITHDVLVPLLLRSRKERQDREAKEQAEQAALAAKQEHQRLKKERFHMRILIVVISGLALAAVGLAAYGWCQAKLARKAETKAEDALQTAVNASQKADKARQEAVTAASHEKAANEKNLRTLHEASMADYAVAVQRIEKDNKWSEGVAHLARSLKWEPGNPISAARLYSTLSLYGAEKQSMPCEILRHNDSVASAQFSPDGTRIVTACYDNTARVWETLSGKPIGEPMHHEGSVWSAQFSADGKRIVTTGGNNTVQVWDAASSKPVSKPMRHEDMVNSAQFSPDGTRIVTACYDKTAQVWDATSGLPIGEPMRHAANVNSAQFSPDGTRIVTASGRKLNVITTGYHPIKGEARVWDAASGKPLGAPMAARMGYDTSVYSAKFSPDGEYIVTASEGSYRIKGEVQVWEAISGKPVGEPLRHADSVSSAQFSMDGSRILTVCADYSVWVWDVDNNLPLGEPLRHAGSVHSAQFSVDGMRIVTACEDNTARAWDAASGKPIGEPLRHEGSVHSAQFSPDGAHIVTASQDMTARVWNAPSRKPMGEPLRHESFVESAQFSADGTRIVTASYDNTARVWDAASGKPVGEPLRHESFVKSAQFSPDGTRIVTASSDNTAQVWDATSGKAISEPMRHEGSVNTAQFSADATRIVTASSDKTARIWDAANGKPIGEPMRHEANVASAQFSTDGTRIVTASYDKTARAWDAAIGKPIGEPLRHEDLVSSAQFSADGTRIVTASWDTTARVWNAASGRLIGEPLRHEKRVMSAQFSPDGMSIVTASEDQTARVWNATSGSPIGEPLRHEEHVNHAQFSADGTIIVTASGDKTARVWDTASGKPLGEPLRHESSVHRAQFSPDGTRIVTSSLDNTARVWDVQSMLHLPLPVPDRMLECATAITGLEFDKEGQMQTIAGEQRLNSFKKQSRGTDPWERLARWLALPANERTLTPESKFTFRQIAERERDSGSEDGTKSALRYDPTVPFAHLLLAKFEYDRQRSAFLIDYGLKRMPEDAVLWSRASSIFLDRQNNSMALEAAQKALALDGNQIAAHRALVHALTATGQKTDALNAWYKVLADKNATFEEFCNAGYVAAELNLGDKARAIFREGEQRFPKIQRILRFKAEALLLLHDPTGACDALKDYDPKDKDETFEELCDVGYLAAELGLAEKARAIFREGEARFPTIPRILRFQGKALLLLHDPAGALEALKAYEPKAVASGAEPQPDAIAALAVSRWLTGDKEGAVKDYQRAIGMETVYSDVGGITKSDWPDSIKQPLLEVLAETLKRHPELRPKKEKKDGK